MILVLSLFFNFLFVAYTIKEKSIPELNGYYVMYDNTYGREHHQLNFYFDKKSSRFELTVRDSAGYNEHRLSGEFKKKKDNIYQLDFEDGTSHSIELKSNRTFLIDYKNGMYLLKFSFAPNDV